MMKLSVDDLMGMAILEGAKVRTGEMNLKEKQVQWISVIEMPVENFVRKNEVVLTTAIGCNNDIGTLLAYVQDIINSEASALMIALGRYIYDIPKEVLDLGDKENFIIIELPWEVRFANIIEEVMRELNCIQFKERERSKKVQEQFLKLLLQEADLKQITNYIKREVEFPIVITDRAGIILEQNSKIKNLDQKWKEYVVKGDIPSREETTPLMHDPMFQKFRLIEIEDFSLVQMPVLQGFGDVQGYLFVLLPAQADIDAFLTTYRVNLLEHAVTTIALWFSRKNAVEGTKMRLRSDFVQELAKGEIGLEDQANSRAKLLGFNLKLPYVCVVGLPENLPSLFKNRKQENHSYEHWTESMVHYIGEEIIYASQSLKREVMMTYQRERLLIFLEIQCSNQVENVTDFLDLVDRRMGSLLPDVIISWGIGDYREGLKGLSESYQHAVLSLNIGRRKNGAGHRMMYENTRIDRVLLNLSRDGEMKEVILSTIESLVHYDEQRNMDLIGTFSAYKQCQGNVSQTARILNLHRQSLLYRLRKIESLTGLSLIDPDDLFLLDLCIKTWKIGLSEA